MLWSAAMIGTAVAADWATPRRFLAEEQPMPALAQLLPGRFADWEGHDASRHQLVAPDVQAVLDALYQQTLARVYQHRRLGTVMLACAYGGDQSDATRVHRPDVCYPAQGFAISAVQSHDLPLGRPPQAGVLPVKRLTARLGSRHEPITYWVTVGGEVAQGPFDQKLIQMRHALHGRVPDGLLMRVSSLDRDAQQAWWMQQRFIDSLWQAVPLEWRPRVFGSHTAQQPTGAAPPSSGGGER